MITIYLYINIAWGNYISSAVYLNICMSSFLIEQFFGVKDLAIPNPEVFLNDLMIL